MLRVKVSNYIFNYNQMKIIKTYSRIISLKEAGFKLQNTRLNKCWKYRQINLEYLRDNKIVRVSITRGFTDYSWNFLNSWTWGETLNKDKTYMNFIK